MKTLFVRLSVLALALTGFTASTVSSTAASKMSSSTAVSTGTSVTPVCDPRGADKCGLH